MLVYGFKGSNTYHHFYDYIFSNFCLLLVIPIYIYNQTQYVIEFVKMKFVQSVEYEKFSLPIGGKRFCGKNF